MEYSFMLIMGTSVPFFDHKYIRDRSDQRGYIRDSSQEFNKKIAS